SPVTRETGRRDATEEDDGSRYGIDSAAAGAAAGGGNGAARRRRGDVAGEAVQRRQGRRAGQGAVDVPDACRVWRRAHRQLRGDVADGVIAVDVNTAEGDGRGDQRA